MPNFIQLFKYIAREGPLKAVRTLSMTNHLMVGELKGVDQFGNKYFESLGGFVGKDRWVVYKDVSKFDASMVPPSWHGWLHHIYDKVPEAAPKYAETPQVNFLSRMGFGANYVPPGSFLRPNGPTKPLRYERWNPESNASQKIANPQSTTSAHSEQAHGGSSQ